MDLNGNPNQRTEIASELQVFTLTPDSTAPSLSSYDLDMDTGVMTFSFSETISVDSFSPALLTLQSDQFGIQTYITLSEGVFLDTNSPTVRLQLSTGDFNRLRISLVARASTLTYISFPSSLLQDTAGVAINPIQSTFALSVDNFTPDVTNPEVGCYLCYHYKYSCCYHYKYSCCYHYKYRC